MTGRCAIKAKLNRFPRFAGVGVNALRYVMMHGPRSGGVLFARLDVRRRSNATILYREHVAASSTDSPGRARQFCAEHAKTFKVEDCVVNAEKML